MAYQRNDSELGALWAHEGPKGPYLTGNINGVQVVCFPARASERGPAWRVMKSKPREERAEQQTRADDDIAF